MKINYDLKFKEELERIKGTKPSLLLHVCCGPCSGNVLKEISEFIEKTGEVQVLPQHKSYILSIKDYSMMVATQLLISRIVLF